MRLTLRTLLAYLDDTLDANEIRAIGQKVSESDDAQELVARIKQVTRRRRLTAPPATGPNAFDPNDVSEYLDNELDADRVRDIEKLCLESDLHLADIAACHQILTLVLGEPALVPPKAKERMYGLVQGREAIPSRKAAAPRRSHDTLEDEETLGLGGGWLRWVLPAAAVLLVGALALAVYQILPPGKGPGRVANAGKQPDEGPPASDPKKDDPPVKKGGEPSGKVDEHDPGKPVNPVPPVGPTVVNPPVKRPGPPDPTPGVVLANSSGGVSQDEPSLLLMRTGPDEKWRKAGRGGVLRSGDTLMALPGFACQVRTRSDVGVLLRGQLHGYLIHPHPDLIAESAAVLHKSDQFDLDLTMLRGRVFLTNQKEKGPVTVRLRFDAEVWDLTLAKPNTEVGIDLMRAYTADINYRKGEEPLAVLHLWLLEGECEVKVDFEGRRLEVEDGKPLHIAWDSKLGAHTQPKREERRPPTWSKVPPRSDEVSPKHREIFRRLRADLLGLEGQLKAGKSVELTVTENVKVAETPRRVLAIYAMGALDMVDKLIAVLDEQDPDRQPDRAAAVMTLRRWLSRSAAQGKLLFDPKAKKEESGELFRYFKRAEVAERVYDLLHDFPLDKWREAETFEWLATCLRHPRVAVAELGWFHLLQLAGPARTKLPGLFNAGFPLEDRKDYAQRIEAMIAKKVLPPMPVEAPDKKDKSPGPKVKGTD